MAFAGIYENMKFPPYEFREYPKAIRLKDGTEVVVAGPGEELALATETKRPDSPRSALEHDAVAAALGEREARIKELEEQLEAVKTAQALNAQGAARPAVQVEKK